MDDERSLLARLDERVKSMQVELHSLTAKFEQYVTHVEFGPVKLIAFGLAGLILSAVIAAVVASVLHR
jgi:hypothetical protein